VTITTSIKKKGNHFVLSDKPNSLIAIAIVNTLNIHYFKGLDGHIPPLGLPNNQNTLVASFP